MKKLLFTLFMLFTLNILTEDLSNKKYNEVRYVMTHNSTTTRSNETKLGDGMRKIVNKLILTKDAKKKLNNIISAITFIPNVVADQSKSQRENIDVVESQLNHGVRAFKLPLNLTGPEFRICHTLKQSKFKDIYDNIDKKIKKILPIKKARARLLQPLENFVKDPCRVDPSTRPLLPVLTTISKWLDAHPDEVVTFFFDVSQLPGEVEKTYGGPLLKETLEKSGLWSKMYVKENASDPWPTIDEMKKSNKRVIIMANTDNFRPIGIWHKGKLGFGSDYEYKNPAALEKDSEAPKIDWGKDNFNNKERKNFLLIVDNYTTPRGSGSIVDAKSANQYNRLKKRIQNYEKLAGQPVTFTMVDFYEQPSNDAIRVVQDLNAGK